MDQGSDNTDAVSPGAVRRFSRLKPSESGTHPGRKRPESAKPTEGPTPSPPPLSTAANADPRARSRPKDRLPPRCRFQPQRTPTRKREADRRTNSLAAAAFNPSERRPESAKPTEGPTPSSLPLVSCGASRAKSTRRREADRRTNSLVAAVFTPPKPSERQPERRTPPRSQARRRCRPFQQFQLVAEDASASVHS
jgi:hypothetical protein